MPWISYLSRDKIGKEWDEIGEGHWDDVTFNDSFICCVWTLCPGSNRTTSGTFVLGQQNPVTMSIRKFLSVLGLQFLCLLCVAVILVIRKKGGNRLSPEVKAAIYFFLWVWNLWSENISSLYLYTAFTCITWHVCHLECYFLNINFNHFF